MTIFSGKKEQFEHFFVTKFISFKWPKMFFIIVSVLLHISSENGREYRFCSAAQMIKNIMQRKLKNNNFLGRLRVSFPRGIWVLTGLFWKVSPHGANLSELLTILGYGLAKTSTFANHKIVCKNWEGSMPLSSFCRERTYTSTDRPSWLLHNFHQRSYYFHINCARNLSATLDTDQLCHRQALVLQPLHALCTSTEKFNCLHLDSSSDIL